MHLFQFGRTPLMFAVLGDFPECVEVLLKNGCDIRIKVKIDDGKNEEK